MPDNNKIDLTKYNNIKQLLADKGLETIDFNQNEKEQKPRGVSDGFVYSNNQQQSYMMKEGKLDKVEVIDENKSLYRNKRDLVQEAITAEIYKRILFDDAPTIGLARPENQPNEKSLYLKSKFIPNFSTLYDNIDYINKKNIVITEDIDNYTPKINEIAVSVNKEDQMIYWKSIYHEKQALPEYAPNNQANEVDFHKYLDLKRNISNSTLPNDCYEQLAYFSPSAAEDYKEWAKNIEGFEKVIAACVFCGEIDFHSENLGIADNRVKKIDHGRSTMAPPKSEKDLRSSLLKDLEHFGYSDFPFNVVKLKEAVNQINSVSAEEIENIIGSKLHILFKEGLHLQNKDIPGINQTFPLTRDEEKENYKIAEEFYNEYFKDQKYMMKEFEEKIDIISRINFSLDEKVQNDWQNRQWLKDIVNLDPISWAVKNDKAIENRDPIVWAIENNKNIGQQEPLLWSLVENYNIDGKNPIVWAVENNKEIEGRKPIIWAYENAYEIDGKKAITWMVENNKEIEGKDPKIWASENNLDIKERVSPKTVADHTFFQKTNNRAKIIPPERQASTSFSSISGGSFSSVRS